MNAEEARRIAGGRTAQRLSGGLLNHVFRVETNTGSVIVKHAPPHVATNARVPLDDRRILFEARALNEVASLGDTSVRVPRVLELQAERRTLILEDLGDLPSLADTEADLAPLGRFIRAVHDRQDAALAATMFNVSVQQTRFDLQYAAAPTMLTQCGLDEARGRPVVDLGHRLRRPGHCLVMGDLWPPSILIGDQLFVIDWELATFGQPAQDLGHLRAHLFLLDRPHTWRSFLSGYGPVENTRDLLLHYVAELLMRSVGPFALKDTAKERVIPEIDASLRLAAEAG